MAKVNIVNAVQHFFGFFCVRRAAVALRCKRNYVYTAFIGLTCCGHFSVEGLENYCQCAWVCHFTLGAFLVASEPFAYVCLPYADPCIDSPFPLVRCIHLHQQISTSNSRCHSA
ncbi:uncharacterized protein LOC107012128 isoform X2 [Solanum pennellii]|uniref:Uncharacterized protein LOC107012128 isoform X2 n=1 Tax=Solanum pennellii TaxID=28526 RepID=A0ABM1G894_SOLPN|nr:uncharacterized protein LOC107012128 isoform X2 [Solanum pennellii]